jgi:hypothetical protein
LLSKIAAYLGYNFFTSLNPKGLLLFSECSINTGEKIIAITGIELQIVWSKTKSSYSNVTAKTTSRRNCKQIILKSGVGSILRSGTFYGRRFTAPIMIYEYTK